MDKSRIFITCPRDIQPYLSEEVNSFGFPVRTLSASGIETEGTLEDTMRLNLLLRTGWRVLYLLETFRAASPADLYRAATEFPWEDYLSGDGYFSVTSTVETSTISDARFASLKCKDAIADRFRKRYGRRPDSGPARDGAVVHLHWIGDRCSLYIDTSGEPLSKRGYRKIPLTAPLQESLAAAVIMATGWRDNGVFINPMCGSGTLAIEAAFIALGKAPGIMRNNFSFMHLRGFNRTRWEEIRREVSKPAKTKPASRIIATDKSEKAVAAALQNAETAGVAHLIEFRRCDFTETPVPEGGGIVLLNPEYGERLGQTSALEKTYAGIGDFFKQKCKGYKGYVFTGNPSLAKKIGLRTKRKIRFFNGNIECRLLEYELYEGSLKNRLASGAQVS